MENNTRREIVYHAYDDDTHHLSILIYDFAPLKNVVTEGISVINWHFSNHEEDISGNLLQ